MIFDIADRYKEEGKPSHLVKIAQPEVFKSARDVDAKGE